MARPVKIQLSLEVDTQIQPGQTPRDLAVAVQQQWEAQGLTVTNVQVDDGATSFSLFPPVGAQQAESELADDAPFDQATPITGPKRNRTKKPRAKRVESLRLPPGHGQERRASKRLAAQDGSIEKDFSHNFQNPAFNKRLRKDGIAKALGSVEASRVRKGMNKRAKKAEAKRWSGYDDAGDDDKKMDLIARELASAFDDITPTAATSAPDPSLDLGLPAPLPLAPLPPPAPLPWLAPVSFAPGTTISSLLLQADNANNTTATASTDAGATTTASTQPGEHDDNTMHES